MQVAVLIAGLILLRPITVLVAKSQTDCPPSHPTPTPTLFRPLALDDVTLTQARLKEIKGVTSELDCGRRCVGVAGCVMVTFLTNQNASSGDCHLYGQLPTAATPRQPWTGARSYALNDWTRCDGGYSMVCGLCLLPLPGIMTYEHARQQCRQRGQGHVVVFTSLPQLHCVQEYVAAKGLTTRLWVGVVYQTATGLYVAADGSCVPLKSTLWCPGQPNGRDSEEHCIQADPSCRRLHDYKCDELSSAICHRHF